MVAWVEPSSYATLRQAACSLGSGFLLSALGLEPRNLTPMLIVAVDGKAENDGAMAFARALKVLEDLRVWILGAVALAVRCPPKWLACSS